jgi:protein-disulfide isomerase
MQRTLKALIVIIAAVGIAAGAAVYLSRTADRRAETPEKSSSIPVEIKSGGHSRGPANAQLTLVEFGDYQCPSCGGFHPLVKEILNRYPDSCGWSFIITR